MKIVDYVICINDSYSLSTIHKGQKYKVYDYDGHHIAVQDDDDINWHSKNIFICVRELREKKLNRIFRSHTTQNET